VSLAARAPMVSTLDQDPACAAMSASSSNSHRRRFATIAGECDAFGAVLRM